MPVYEYVCQSGHTFERKQKITDKPLTTCPRVARTGKTIFCGESVKRLISKGTSFTLKGGGWGKDGYG